MSWQDLLVRPGEIAPAPWMGGRVIRIADQRLTLQGERPAEYGWYHFELLGRKARWCSDGVADIDPVAFFVGVSFRVGYLVGDRILFDRGAYVPDPAQILAQSEPVGLVPPGLDRFARAAVAVHGDRLLYVRAEFPLGPEPEVLVAFEDRADSVATIPGVTPALELAFRFETWLRAEGEERRRRLAEVAARAEAERALEAHRQDLVRRLGDGAGRRVLARVDFETAARAALAVGGAELLDARASHTRGEKVVRFRYRNRRFECVCDETLHVLDAGICLQGNDRLFTLESLPLVIGEAQDRGVLHVFRHVDGDIDDADAEDE